MTFYNFNESDNEKDIIINGLYGSPVRILFLFRG